MNNFEINAYLYIIIKIIVIIATLNWGLIALNTNFNIITLISNIFPIEYNEIVQKTIQIIFALSAFYIMLQRKTFLPFLDTSVVPINKFLKESKQKKYELEIIIDGEGGEKVIYWASKKSNKSDKMKNYKDAYGNFENSGISIIDKNGKAKLYIKCPQDYYVNNNQIIPKHIHYRIVKDGLLSEVKTINLKC